MTSVGWIVLAYLIIGALCAVGCALGIRAGLDHQGESAKVDAAMRDVERNVGRIPGGMPTVLISVTALWPACVAIMIRNRMK